MDGHRFDEFTRRLGAGLSRRQMVRVLLGGAGALAGSAVLSHRAAAAGAGEPCLNDVDCDGDLLCGNQETCECNPSVSQDGQCPEGSPVSGNAGLEGSCCEGHGNCCSRNCVAGACAPPEICGEADAECSEHSDCCEGLLCCEGACTDVNCCATEDCAEGELCCDNLCVEGNCCNFNDCTDTNDCFRAACNDFTCEYTPADDLCEGACETCNRAGLCVGCGSEELCCGETCVEGECCEDSDCPSDPCLVVSCYQGQCTALPLCDADERCCETTEIAYCIPDDGCCSADDCVVAGAGDFSCLEIDCVENICTWVPNDHHCPLDTCCCEDGSCSDKCCDQSSECHDDHDCPNGECCCKDGHCSPRCCPERLCKVDKDCRKGECCCKDGTCSHKCCPDDETPDDDVPVQELPDTGTGPGGDMTSWIAGAALLGGAAALLGAKLRDEDEPVTESES